MSEQVYPSVFILSSLQETRAWVRQHSVCFHSEVIVRRPFVMVSVNVWIGETAFVIGYGFAKCAAGDKWDEGVGIALARFRAERDAAQQVYKYTLGGKMDGVKQCMSTWAKEAEQAMKGFTEALKPLMDEWAKHDSR